MSGSGSEQKRLNLSVVIITKNAERTLNTCLSSLPPHCEIIVVDSGSTDKTLQIASSHKAKISTRTFTNYAEQKNAALELASRDYVLSVDADEELDEVLRSSLISLSSQRPGTGLYAVQRRLVFMDRVMRFGRTTDYPVRLCCKAKASFVGHIHEELRSHDNNAPTTITINGTMLHHSYANLAEYFDKFNRYTTMIAEERLTRGIKPPSTVSLALRPVLNFLYRYFWCGGCLDGFPGYCWALLGSFYSFVKYAKFRELSLNAVDRKNVH